MTSYLSRPVWPVQVNWATQPPKELTYDLREQLLGFSAVRFEQLQGSTRHGYEVEVLLDTEALLVEWESFMAQTQGRLNGFWFPAPFAAVQLDSASGATNSLVIRNEGFQAWYADHPAVYLAFSKPGQTTQFGKISSVGINSTGQEVITLTSALSTAVDQTWDVSRLLYCRMAEDEDTLEFLADNKARKTAKVIELTEEYAEIESSVLKVYLYQFSQTYGQTTTYWRLTGLNQSITSQSQAFGTYAIEHSNMTRTMKGSPTLTVTSWYGAANPLSLFVPFKAPVQMDLTIYETTFSAPNTRTTIFSGRVQSVEYEGKLISATVGHSFMAQKFPRFYIGPRCNHYLYDQDCGVTEASYTVIGTIAGLDGRSITVNVSDPPLSDRTDSGEMNWFALGWIEVGVGETYEFRAIRQNSAPSEAGVMTVRLDRALEYAAVTDTIKLIAGCDGSSWTCDRKFRNMRRWGGHVVPPENSVVDPLTDELAATGKK